MTFAELSLEEKIVLALDSNGFNEPTPIQQASIPAIIAHKDVLASAKTGSGKTAAFILPTLHNLITQPRQQGTCPRALVLTPTRELASQIKDCITQFSKNIKLNYGVIVGGSPYPPQIKLLSRPVDILVATPGRLLDHLEAGRLDLSKLEILILDEADRMLDMGFLDAIQSIAKHTPPNRQTLLFSATLENKSVIATAHKLLSNPERIEVDSIKQEHSQIQQFIHFSRNINHKKSLLISLLNQNETELAIIFTATKRCADDLAKEIRSLGHRCAALHGDMSQAARNRTIDRFKNRQIHFLFATDVAARGIDIKDISHVINFDLPKNPEDYVHRIGRTGRAGASGVAISLVAHQDKGVLKRIERLIRKNLETIEIKEIPAPKPLSVVNQYADANIVQKQQNERSQNSSGYMRSHTRRGNSKDFKGNTLSPLESPQTSIETKAAAPHRKPAKRVKPENQSSRTAFAYGNKSPTGKSNNIKHRSIMTGIGPKTLREPEAHYATNGNFGNEFNTKPNKTVVKHQVRNKKIATTHRLNIDNAAKNQPDEMRIQGRISLKKSPAKPLASTSEA